MINLITGITLHSLVEDHCHIYSILDHASKTWYRASVHTWRSLQLFSNDHEEFAKCSHALRKRAFQHPWKSKKGVWVIKSAFINANLTCKSAVGTSFAVLAKVSLTNLWEASKVSMFTRQTLTDVVPTSIPNTKLQFLGVFLWDLEGDVILLYFCNKNESHIIASLLFNPFLTASCSLFSIIHFLLDDVRSNMSYFITYDRTLIL